jgi:CDP-4-dehydro-6-deoxyglucose reductase
MSAPEPRLVKVEVVAVGTLSPRVQRLALSPRGPDPLEWEPGQYVEVGVAGSGKRQPYSIASAPDPERPGYFELAVLRGSAAGALDDVPVGDLLEVFGPKGRFVLGTEGDVPEIFIGTGTGVAPLRAMLQAAFAAGGSAPKTLLFGARSENEILWNDELVGLAEREARFRFEPTLSQATNGWTGRRGYVQDHLSELVEPFREGRIYVCGVSEMVRECREKLLHDLGVAPERVFSEEH